MFAAGHPCSPFTSSGSGEDLGDGAALGIFQSLVRSHKESLLALPLGPTAPEFTQAGVGWGVGCGSIV